LKLSNSSRKVIKEYCNATPDEVQKAIRDYKQKVDEAEALVLGMEIALGQQLKDAKAQLRRLSS
jgi:hypothetical protein